MKPSGQRGRILGAAAMVAAVGGVLTAATAVSRHFFEQPAIDEGQQRLRRGHQHDEERRQNPESLFLVAQLEGQVEALHRGTWVVVMAGDRLSTEDVLRTKRGARAVLRRRDTEVEVSENVDIRLDELADKTASFGVLRGGNVVASVGAADERVQITALGTRAVNEGVARFAVFAAPGGHVSVAALKGNVLFDAQGRRVRVPQGNESTAPPGRQPGDPSPIPEELLLSVYWPPPEEPIVEERAEISGKVRPSSRVKVNGEEASMAGDGRFSAVVPLQVGPNRVEVEARDIAGRKKAVNRVVRRTARAPTLEPADEELWKK